MKKEKTLIIFKLVSYILLILIIFLFSYLIGLMYTTSHENIHVLIFNRYNITVEEYDIDYIYLSGSVTPNQIEFWERCNDDCKFQHAMNDIVGYNVRNIIIAAIILFLCWLHYKEFVCSH